MEININGLEFKVERNGSVYRKRKDKYKLIEGSKKTSGYLIYDSGIIMRDKIKTRFKLSLHRIVACAYLGLDYTNKTICIDHIDGVRCNNNVENLRIVSHMQNSWNRKNVKGFTIRYGKYIAEIQVNRTSIPLGVFKTEHEARNAYIQAKQKYHLIPLRIECESLYLIKPIVKAI